MVAFAALVVRIDRTVIVLSADSHAPQPEGIVGGVMPNTPAAIEERTHS